MPNFNAVINFNKNLGQVKKFIYKQNSYNNVKDEKGDSYMNYYNPNYYMNPYQNYQMQMQQPMATTQVQPPQALNGKIVDSSDVVKATEVPIGGYGIFPKADLSEIYIKSWNNNGTTSIITFKPIVTEPAEIQKTNEELTNTLIQKIDGLENKIDQFISQSPIEQLQIKKEVPKNGF